MTITPALAAPTASDAVVKDGEKAAPTRTPSSSPMPYTLFSALPKVVAGSVCVESKGDAVCDRVEAGAPLPRRLAWLVVGREGATLVFPSGAKVELEGGSRVKLEGKGMVTSYRGDLDADLLKMSEGRARVTVPAKKGRRRAVQILGATPLRSTVSDGSAIVRSADRLMSVATLEGERAVLSNGKRRAFAAVGQVKQMRAGGEVTERALPNKPRTIRCRTLAFAGTTFGEPVTVRWEREPSAYSYEVLLRRASDGLEMTRGLVTGEEVAARFPALPAGKFTAIVRGVDVDGFVGPWSEPLGIDVVGARLPADARVAPDGTVLVPRKGAVVLTHTSGLEGASMLATSAEQAPTRLAPEAGASNVLTLRRPGQDESISMRVMPIRVSAAISFAPSQSIDEPMLALTVKLHANDGGAVPSSMGVRPTVLLGAERVELAWRRDGDTLRAVLPLSRISNGERLRVRVIDDSGDRLGEGFWGATSEVASRLKANGRAWRPSRRSSASAAHCLRFRSATTSLATDLSVSNTPMPVRATAS